MKINFNDGTNVTRIYFQKALKKCAYLKSKLRHDPPLQDKHRRRGWNKHSTSPPLVDAFPLKLASHFKALVLERKKFSLLVEGAMRSFFSVINKTCFVFVRLRSF